MNEKAKRLLSLYKDNALEIARLESELSLWRARSQRVRCDEVCALLDVRLAQAAARRADTETLLNRLTDERLKLLLELHYIDGLTWERVAEQMRLELRWVMRLHKRALSCL